MLLFRILDRNVIITKCENLSSVETNGNEFTKKSVILSN